MLFGFVMIWKWVVGRVHTDLHFTSPRHDLILVTGNFKSLTRLLHLDYRHISEFHLIGGSKN